MLTGSGAQAIMQFLVLIVLARLLDPESFGIVNAALVVISLTIIFSTLGVGPALIQKDKISEEHIKTAFTTSIALGVIFALLIYIFAPTISLFFHTEKLIPVLRTLTIVFLLQGLAIVAESLIQRDLKFNIIVRIQLISYFTYGVLGVFFALLDYGVWALAIAHISQMFVKCILALYLQPHTFKLGFNRLAFKELLVFSGGYSLAKVSGEVSLQGDNIIVGRFLGPEALGLYGRAYQLMVFPTNLFGKVMEKVLFPAMAKVQNNNKRLQYAFKQSIKLIAAFTIPISVFMFITAKDIVLFLFGSQWLEMVMTFQILALGLLFRTSYKISDALAKAKGAVYKRALIKWIYAFFVLAGALIGQNFGIEGVAFGALIAIVMNYVMMAYLSINLIGLSWITFLKCHLSSIILGILVLILLPINKLAFFNSLIPFTVLIINGLVFLIIIFGCIALKPNFFIGAEGVKLISRVKVKLKCLIPRNKYFS